MILEDLEKSRAEGKNELSDEARNAIDQPWMTKQKKTNYAW